MKKYLMVCLLAISTSLVFGQSKLLERKVNKFVEEAKEELHLDLTDKAKDALVTERTEYLIEIADLRKQVKSGELDLKEANVLKNAADEKFDKKLAEITEKTTAEVEEFTEKVKEELKID